MLRGSQWMTHMLLGTPSFEMPLSRMELSIILEVKLNVWHFSRE